MGGPRRRLLALSKQTPFDQRKEPPNRDAVPFYVTRNFHVFLTFFGGGRESGRVRGGVLDGTMDAFGWILLRKAVLT